MIYLIGGRRKRRKRKREEDEGEKDENKTSAEELAKSKGCNRSV